MPGESRLRFLQPSLSINQDAWLVGRRHRCPISARLLGDWAARLQGNESAAGIDYPDGLHAGWFRRYGRLGNAALSGRKRDGCAAAGTQFDSKRGTGRQCRGLVTARVDYGQLDRTANPVRLRLNSPVIRVAHAGDAASARHVTVTYFRDGKALTARAGGCVLALLEHDDPYLCPNYQSPRKPRCTAW